MPIVFTIKVGILDVKAVDFSTAFLIGGYMENLKLVKIDLEYIKYLYQFDNRVQYNASKDNNYNSNRPYIGILLSINGYNYFAPLEHPRPQHKSLKSSPHIIKIANGKYGLIGLNNMIPVPDECIIQFDLTKEKNKDILLSQFVFCDKNKATIISKAKIVYEKRLNPNKFEQKIYCDFTKLEEAMNKYISSEIQLELTEKNHSRSYSPIEF